MTDTWQPGPGVLVLEDAAKRSEYGAACKRAVLDGMARHVSAGRTREERRARLRTCPRKMQDQVETLVREMWRTNHEN